MNADWLWDREIPLEEVKEILKDCRHERFAEFAALLLSRKNTSREVFRDYIGKDIFLRNWPIITKGMSRNSWNDPRIIQWQAAYERMVKSFKEKGIPLRIAGKSSVTDELCFQVGSRIKALRQENNLTQKALAERLGVAQQVVSRIERGNANVGLLTLKKIAKVLNRKVIVEFA